MLFLERDSYLTELDTARACATAGQGAVVLLSGEAGIGKTTLVERLAARVEHGGGRVLWGACDALFTPRPLGPLLDMARHADAPLAALLRSGADREQLFGALLDELSSRSSRVAIFEDVHWADEATLDLLKFLGRRIRRTRGLLILTFRDDEVEAGHPLLRLIGELPPEAVRRLRLRPLSAAAVSRLAAAAGRPAGDLHAVTGGNPFYVTELLAAEGGGPPVSVRDALRARAAALPPDARAVLDAVAIVPGRTERWLLEGVLGEAARGAEDAVRAGILAATRDAVAFRHELARRAWESALDPAHAADLHGRVLRVLAGRSEGGLLSRRVHHADGSADAETVLDAAPAAAREAAALGAHREAAAHYATALRYAAGLAPAVRAALLDAWAYETHLGGRIAEAVGARLEALSLWRQVGDARREGDTLRALSRLAWFEGRRADAAAYADEAIRVLEPVGPCHELAMAYSTRAQLHILSEERHLAPAWGDRAVALAEALDDPEALVHALTNAACLEPGSAREQQVRAARLAQHHALHEHALRAFAWLISDAIVEQDYALADAFLPEALAYAEARDIDAFAFYLRGWHARMWVERGRLREAQEDASDVLARTEAATVVRLPSLAALGTVLARTGQEGADAVLDEALELALATGELQRIAPVANARAEAAWLRGDVDAVRREALRAYPLAVQANSPWDAARLAVWLHRVSALDAPPPGPPGPFEHAFAGRWHAAAEAWGGIGCPYEQALALAEGDEAAQREALAILDALDARPAAALLRVRLQRSGVRAVPRGPRRTTRANPAGLTNRQLDVLALLADGLSNQEIGRRLFLSTRTVDHHVSALLRKLGVPTRAGAARIARDLRAAGSRAAPP